MPQHSETNEPPEFDPVQRSALDALSHAGCGRLKIKQLSTRCKAPCPEVYRAMSELERLGYVNLRDDLHGYLWASRCYVRQPTKPPGASDPVAPHIRIVGPMVHGEARTEQKIGAVHCELTKEQRRAVLRELVHCDCLEACFDRQGIPAYRVKSPERAEAGLDVLREEKWREAERATSVA
jgi:hypothetical protein